MPATNALIGSHNKTKIAVTGTVAHPALEIPDGARCGVNLRTCLLHVPAIKVVLPMLTDLITESGPCPYDMSTRRGRLRYILVATPPDDDLLVYFVLHSRRYLGQLRAAAPDLRRHLSRLVVAAVDIRSVYQTVVEGPEGIVLIEEDRLLMRLSLSSPGLSSRAG